MVPTCMRRYNRPVCLRWRGAPTQYTGRADGRAGGPHLVPIMVDGDHVLICFAENCDDSTPVAHGLVSGRFSTSKPPTGTEMLSSVILLIRGTD